MMKTLEDLLSKVGDAGRMQFVLVTAVMVPKLWVGYFMLEMSFANFVPKWCCLPDDLDGDPSSRYCDINTGNGSFEKTCEVNSTSCSVRVFQTVPQTVTNEWDLVCDRKWMRPLVTSMQMVGLTVGGVVSGQLSDGLGRRRVLMASIFGMGVVNIAAGFSTSVEMFTVFRFFLGVFLGMYFVVHLPYVMEFVSPRHRAIPSLIPTFHLGVAILAFVAWQTEDWRWVHWIGGLACVPCALTLIFLPESMRWLAVNGKSTDAMLVVEKIARWNRRPVPDGAMDLIKTFSVQQKDSQTTNKYTYIHIYNTWKMFRTSVITQFIWFTMSLATYGISFGASSLGFEVYLNIFLLAAVTVPFLFMLKFVIAKIGRTKAAALFYAIPSVCGFIALLISFIVSEGSPRSAAIAILFIISRGCLGTAWAAVMTLTNESYPTVVRSLGYGAANVWARLGGVVAPFAVDFEDAPRFAYGIVGVGCLMCTVGVMMLTETSGHQMVDILPENIAVDDGKDKQQNKPEYQNEAFKSD